MIKVEELTKRYAGVTAVKGISFEVGSGEVVGFLGPNGAGKSTTMRVLSCYLPPSGGRVSVAGFDVVEQSEEVRKRIGYLPESNPLYTDMRVSEYLRYRAALKNVPGRQVRGRVDEVMKLTDLKDVQHRIIGQLSKGYKQRVGLADAIVHEPDLLILDEPTIGLDPNQIRLVRALIADLGKRHTILLSTHILSEVEMLCSRVIILNKGKIEACDTPVNLEKKLLGGRQITLVVKGAPDGLKAAVATVAGVRDVEVAVEGGNSLVQLWSQKEDDPREALFHLAVQMKWVILEMTAARRSLEEVFVQLTHHEE